MADDDNLDLDDDLDLGDDLDSGDDFAGELDDMMGDDELGGDSDESDGDGELDSFFEDLSSIEEMDDDDGGGDAPAAAPKAPPQPTAAPVAAAPAAAAGSSGGKSKVMTIMMLLMLLGGGAGVYFKFFNGGEEFLIEEAVEQAQVLPEEPIVPKIKPMIQVERIRAPEPVMPKPAPKPVYTNTRQYMVQVATCSFDKCREEYITKLRGAGEPVFEKDASEKFDFIELVSKQVYSYRRAKYFVDLINRSNKQAGNASIVYQSNGHRVTMGTFTALDRAKKVKFYLEKQLKRGELIFTFEHVRKGYQTTKIYAGPYRSRSVAKKVFNSFKTKKLFPGSFIVRK